jgi:hypothetical protein
MVKNLFSNRLFIGALAFFILCVVGGTLYMWHVERQLAEYAAETQDRVAQWKEKQKPTTEISAADIPQEHLHQDGTFHAAQPIKQMNTDGSETKDARVRSASRSTDEGILEKIGKFNVFENYISELPLPNQAELEKYWTLETFTAAAREYWEERGGLEISDAEFNQGIQETYQQHLDEYGFPPAPPGYYITIPSHAAASGKAYYSKKNEFYIDLVWDKYGTNTKRLSSEDWEIYKILNILTPGDTSFTVQPLTEDYAAVAWRWAQELEDSTFGPIPTFVDGGGSFDLSYSHESVNALSEQKADEIQKAFEQYWGLPTRPPENGYNIDIQRASFVLDEIEKKLAKGDR